ncbi:metallophosphoesterase [Echinicola sp. 20G]|uniref:metallophosphoesterase n=1 Tax=Echinicola sp. 20G TaxID=2781961 RepID=UPI001F4082D6|nr:metallophosphoesterase [Echinicola sp. 20G]
MEFSRKKMVNWYDPKQLAFTGMKTIISGIFGNFADKREIQAALDKDNPDQYDYSEKDEIWIDYISDLGDGFDATYTMASLLAKENLDVNGSPIKRGDILVMGGDEVYPTPELEEYRNRLQGPYHAAFPKQDNDPNPPDLFAIPGNHDWYDGLTNFLRIFCQKRSLGNWRTQQSRSYFALKLPHNYWLIALDIQLNSDIDYPQIQYFREIAEHQIQANDKIIIATAEPSWVYRSFDQKNSSHNRFEFFINNILLGKSDGCYNGKNENIQISTILTGDLHHYARYEEKDEKGQIRQLVTAGGGGAFMHLTHILKDSISPRKGSSGVLKATFPSKNDSRSLALKNFVFPIYSLTMIAFFGLFHGLTALMLHKGQDSPLSIFVNPNSINDYYFDIHIPVMVIVFNLILWGGIILFTDNSSGNGNWNYIAGFFHGLLHVAIFYFMLYITSILFNLMDDSWQYLVIYFSMLIIISGITSAIIFGIYLFISVNFLDNHITEGSSSFRYEGYKNFLRIHINSEALTIYPFGVKAVVKDWQETVIDANDKDQTTFKGSPIQYELIENPIIIRHEKAL